MDAVILPVMIFVGIPVLIVVGFLMLVKAFYIKVPQGTALIVNDTSTQPKVSFTGKMVLPVINKKETMRISLITLEIDRRGKDGLICRDNLRADITVAFYLRVNETPEDVLKVAKSIGVERASDKDAVNELFNAKFSEALKTVGKQMEFVKLFEDRIQFREMIVEVIGDDLNGYALEDVAIDYLEQTPKQALDPSNIMDAEGIRKITEKTAEQNVQTNDLERNEQLAIKKKNVEAKEALLALELQQSDAEARQKREVQTIQAREQAEIDRVKEEEKLKAERARIDTDREVAVLEEGKMREVEVAEQSRARAVVIEQEKVKRAQELEQVARQRDVELQQIEKEKALEEQKKAIANVIRERIAVEKTVAEEEERINEVREVSEADRAKQVTILQAQADAEKDLVKEVKAAEAEEVRAKHKAAEVNIMAQAELEAASKQAESKKKMAEGVEREQAAPGLAQARVAEAQAEAKEKQGLVDAKILEERMAAEAQGREKVGLAEAKVTEVKAVASERQGLMEAKVMEEKLTAQAQGEEALGLAQARASKEKGLVDAEIVREHLRAEAEGLIEKFKAMDSMSEQARAHEEFRMELEKQVEQVLATLETSKVVAEHQAQVTATALKDANIDIVGGDGKFLDTMTQSISMGKAVDGLLEQSPILRQALSRLLPGEAALNPGKEEKEA